MAIIVILLIESYEKNPANIYCTLKNTLITALLIMLFMLLLLGHLGNFYEYGLYGVVLIVVTYFAKSKPIQLIFGVAIIMFFAVISILKDSSVYNILMHLLPLLSMVLIMFYNKQKGKLNLKYLFYIAYPVNFLLIYLIM